MHNGYCAKWKCDGSTAKCYKQGQTNPVSDSMCDPSWTKLICEQYHCIGEYIGNSTTTTKYFGKLVAQNEVFCGHLANKYDPEAGKTLPNNCCNGDKSHPKCSISQGHFYNAQYIFEDPTSGGYFNYTSCGVGGECRYACITHETDTNYCEQITIPTSQPLFNYSGKEVPSKEVFCGNRGTKYDSDVGKRLPDSCCTGDRSHPKCQNPNSGTYNAKFIFKDPTALDSSYGICDMAAELGDQRICRYSCKKDKDNTQYCIKTPRPLPKVSCSPLDEGICKQKSGCSRVKK